MDTIDRIFDAAQIVAFGTLILFLGGIGQAIFILTKKDSGIFIFSVILAAGSLVAFVGGCNLNAAIREKDRADAKEDSSRFRVQIDSLQNISNRLSGVSIGLVGLADSLGSISDSLDGVAGGVEWQIKYSEDVIRLQSSGLKRRLGESLETLNRSGTVFTGGLTSLESPENSAALRAIGSKFIDLLGRELLNPHLPSDQYLFKQWRKFYDSTIQHKWYIDDGYKVNEYLTVFMSLRDAHNRFFTSLRYAGVNKDGSRIIVKDY